MFLPGLLAYRSVLSGGIPVSIPDLRKKEERDKYRNDTFCTDKTVGGDMYVPPFSKGKIEITDKVYQIMYQRWQEDLKSDK